MIGAPLSSDGDHVTVAEFAVVLDTSGRPGADGFAETVTSIRPVTSRSGSPEPSSTVNFTVIVPLKAAAGVAETRDPLALARALAAFDGGARYLKRRLVEGVGGVVVDVDRHRLARVGVDRPDATDRDERLVALDDRHLGVGPRRRALGIGDAERHEGGRPVLDVLAGL